MKVLINLRKIKDINLEKAKFYYEKIIEYMKDISSTSEIYKLNRKIHELVRINFFYVFFYVFLIFS